MQFTFNLKLDDYNINSLKLLLRQHFDTISQLTMDQSTKIAISEKTLPLENRGVIAKMICYYFSFIAFGLVTGVFGPTLPRLAENTHTRIGDIGFLLTALLGIRAGFLSKR